MYFVTLCNSFVRNSKVLKEIAVNKFVNKNITLISNKKETVIMSNLSINGDGNLPIKDTGVNAGENVASSSTPQMNSVWGEFLENGDNTVDAGDVQLRENATDLQKRAVRDFFGVHKGREWTEKLVNIVKNLLTNPAAIEEVSNNGVYTRAIIKDEKGNDYQISYDNIINITITISQELYDKYKGTFAIDIYYKLTYHDELYEQSYKTIELKK